MNTMDLAEARKKRKYELVEDHKVVSFIAWNSTGNSRKALMKLKRVLNETINELETYADVI
jgi:hypothetical protein